MGKKRKQQVIPITGDSVSWRRMLEAIPRQNVAAGVECRDDDIVCAVPLKRPKWMIPPVSWVIHLSPVRRVRMDGIGSEVWRWCDGQRTVEDVVDEFRLKYALSFHEARVAVTGYLRLLIERGVLAIEQWNELPTT